MMGDDLFSAISARLDHARAKHPVFAEGPYQALGVICEEVRELEQAVLREGPERTRDELLDVIVTCVRMWLGEHELKIDKMDVFIKKDTKPYTDKGCIVIERERRKRMRKTHISGD